MGDPGVGKTAVAEGLALRIHEKSVPEALLETRIYALDMGAVLAGTKFRGEFEARLKGIITALKGNPDAILFIDEIHTVVGAGATSGGSLDASNILKPVLASGELKCIGSTTYHDYGATSSGTGRCRGGSSASRSRSPASTRPSRSCRA